MNFRRWWTATLGGAAGGILGTGLMIGVILLGLAILGEPGGVASTLFNLAFGGSAAGSPSDATAHGIPIHFLHGVGLGALFGAIFGASARFLAGPARFAGLIGVGLGILLGGAVLGLLAGPGGTPVTAELAGLVLSAHVVFGASVALGAWGFSRLWGESRPTGSNNAPASSARGPTPNSRGKS